MLDWGGSETLPAKPPITKKRSGWGARSENTNEERLLPIVDMAQQLFST
jgi:hypothetical protein